MSLKTRKAYEKARIAVDPVIFTIDDNKLKILIKQREKEPHKGRYELPGGLLRSKETADDTLKRKLREQLGMADTYFIQFSTFTNPNRDLRERTISIGFITLVNSNKIKDLTLWKDYSSLPPLAFDHKEIIEKARAYLKENIDHHLVQHFLSHIFPLNQLQNIYELIEEKTYDNRNFRKKMIAAGIVEETDGIEQNVSHRPAKLFKFKK